MTAAFDDLMGTLDVAMAIVTTASGDERSGCLVGFHVQCGMEPSRYAIWVSKANHTYRVAVLSDVFAVHFLRPAHRDLAELFGHETGDEVDKFTRCRWTEGPGGVPLLDDCGDRFAGRRVGLLDPDTDHVCIVLEPLDVEAATASTGETGGWLRSSDIVDIEAGHPATDRQRP